MCQDYENALREYDLLNAIYMKQQRCENLEYAIMRNNTAQVLEKLGRLREAGDVMLSVLELDQRISVPESIQAGHMRNTANILSLLGDNAQALACSEKALAMRTKIFGLESPWTADAQAVHARILFHLDKTRQAEELIDQACRVLQESWGSSHRFTVNALTIQKEIEGHASP
jgi:tetratricopeptide (TPR) repeat protein